MRLEEALNSAREMLDYPEMAELAKDELAQVESERTALEPDVTVKLIETRALLALQGPAAEAVLAELDSIIAELPDSDEVVFRQLGELQVSTKNRDDARETVHRLYYQLTPLRSGAFAGSVWQKSRNTSAPMYSVPVTGRQVLGSSPVTT